MMNEHWVRWKPIPGLAANYYIDAVIQNETELCITLSEDGKPDKIVYVVFSDNVISYRHTDESFRTEVFTVLGGNYGESFYQKWPFFIIYHSSYLNSFFEHLDEQKLWTPEMKHFCFFGINAATDVISIKEPRIYESY